MWEKPEIFAPYPAMGKLRQVYAIEWIVYSILQSIRKEAESLPLLDADASLYQRYRAQRLAELIELYEEIITLDTKGIFTTITNRGENPSTWGSVSYPNLIRLTDFLNALKLSSINPKLLTQ